MVSLFTSQTPALTNLSEFAPLTLGTTLMFSEAGNVTGARIYAPDNTGGAHSAVLWRTTVDDSGGSGSGEGVVLASASFGALTPSTWNEVTFSSPVPVVPGEVYVISWRSSEGRYTATGGFFTSALVNGPITGIEGDSAPAFPTFGQLFNGRFRSDITDYPDNTFGRNAYFVDVIFEPSGGEDVELAAALTATGTLGAALTRETLLASGLTATGTLAAGMTRETLLAAPLTATGTLAVDLTREKSLAAGLTATGTLGAALSRETTLATPLTASGTLSAALTTETTLAAALSASGTLSVAMTIPSTGPQDLIASPVAAELLACFTEKLQELPDPPKYIQMRVGQSTGPLIGPGVDECCSGLAWVRVADVYPSWDSFPQADNTWTPCGPLAYAVVLEMGMAFCMPWSTSEGTFEDVDPPSTADWAAAHATQMRNQAIMRQTAACCFRPTQRRAVGGWTSLAVEGGCTGGTLTVTVSVMNPCSDC